MTEEGKKPASRVKLQLIPDIQAEAVDPFSLERLRLSAAATHGAVTKKTETAEARKPKKNVFIRVHPSLDYTFQLQLLEFDRHLYLVDYGVQDFLRLDSKPMMLFTCVERTGGIFLWPISLNAGSDNPWVETARDIAETAKSSWVRVASNVRAGRYEAVVATIEIPEPVWPDKSFPELLKLAALIHERSDFGVGLSAA